MASTEKPARWGQPAAKHPFGAVRANYGQGDHYLQVGLGMSGTLLLHRGGLTAGPYTSDTFALIHAEGAQGATVQNGQGAVIDYNGYALLPSLTPYRENTVSLNTLHMRADAELNGGSQRVVPYAGAVSQVSFATLRGTAVLISLNTTEGMAPPMGAEVRDASNTVIGVVGQGSQLYARVPHDSGSLQISWDGKPNAVPSIIKSPERRNRRLSSSMVFAGRYNS
ncbi:fimbria/pilus outer membrane usher protein (plasmid) [Pseudomonas silvicola]|nr:fimbria/pilus outer membrane usher protein [Pseudomonas silvicola]